ncbi:hypothetical protein [Saccharopolyspora shandongensis]|uniref:hypothetical protein n=1 Tax=Saccharopolyspora shandongensis TaxID=418495 RepID=UPI0033C8FDCF
MVADFKSDNSSELPDTRPTRVISQSYSEDASGHRQVNAPLICIHRTDVTLRLSA